MPLQLAMRSRLKQYALKYLIDSCNIERETTGVNAMGAPAHTHVQVAANVKCRIIRAGATQNGEAAMIGDQEALEETYRVILPIGTDVQVNYRIVFSGETWYVTRIDSALTDNLFVQAFVTRQRGGGYGY